MSSTTSMEDLLPTLEAHFAADDVAGAEALVAGFADSDPARHALGLAALAAHRKDPAACETYAREALALRPADPAALQYQAVAALLRDRPAEALAPLREAAQAGSTRALGFLGNVLLGLGRLKEAEGVYQQILTREPTHVQALNGVGTARFKQQDLDGAVPYFARAWAARPSDSQPLRSLMNAYGDAGRALGALALLGITRERHQDAQSRAALAMMHLHLTRMVLPSFPPAGEISDADEAVHDLLSAVADQPLALRLAAARALGDYGRHTEAAGLLAAVDPESPELSKAQRADLWYTRGLSAAARDNRQAALHAYTQAVAQDPQRWEAAANAISLLLLEEESGGRVPEEAAAQIRDLLQRVPAAVRGTAPQLLFNEAVFLRRTGHPAEAARLCQRVLHATGGDGELAEHARELLQGLTQGAST